jgi:putative phosphoesterase
MKVGTISDIHIDVNKDYPILELLVKKIREYRLDCLIIAGDISNHISVTLDFIDRIRELSGKPVYFVPGNHDIWDQNGEFLDTWKIYRSYQEHPACLVNRYIPLAYDWVVLGDIGWYDYSYGNKIFTRDEFDKKMMYDRIWKDSIHLDWRLTDEQVHKNMLDGLEKQLSETAGKKQIAVTHMITNNFFAVPENREPWSYFNAFLGSDEYGGLFERCGVKYSIMGHVHFRRHHTTNGVSYICSCLNYSSEWKSNDCEREIDEALTIINLE